MNKLLVILGSTSTGKTDLALRLAKRFNGELVSCDSRQVYTGLDIGTGKLPGKKVVVEKGNGFWKMDGVKVWMYDVRDPKRQYTVYDYVKDANKVINDILKREKLPIIVGGTAFYLKALLEGLPNLGIPVDQKLRKQINNLEVKQLQQKLQEISPDKWNSLNRSDRQNPRRLVRAIETAIMSLRGFRLARDVAIFLNKLRDYDILKIGLTAPRAILYQRIDERVISRVNQGIIEEAESLKKEGQLSLKRMKQLGLEYGVLADYLAGRIISKEELINKLQNKIHGFARRQITWFKKEKNIDGFDITKKGTFSKVEKRISEWYH